MGLVLNFTILEEMALSGESSKLTTTALIAEDQLPIEDTAAPTNDVMFLIEDGITIIDSSLNSAISIDLIEDSIINADSSLFNHSLPFIVDESFAI
ncbi:MAG: hypothetical protein HOH75_00145, partial [Chloroflexi bacterium]|nr:hypothetical protein [Chloroflexota bacterium]